MADDQEDYPCVGVCIADPDSGYCLGCGRPPLPSPSGPEVCVAAPESKMAPRPAAPAGE